MPQGWKTDLKRDKSASSGPKPGSGKGAEKRGRLSPPPSNADLSVAIFFRCCAVPSGPEPLLEIGVSVQGRDASARRHKCGQHRQQDGDPCRLRNFQIHIGFGWFLLTGRAGNSQLVGLVGLYTVIVTGHGKAGV